MPTSAKRKPAVIVNRVTEFREEKPWTRAGLARKAGIAEQTLARMEEGLPTRKDNRLRVARALGKMYETVFPNNDD